MAKVRIEEGKDPRKSPRKQDDKQSGYIPRTTPKRKDKNGGNK